MKTYTPNRADGDWGAVLRYATDAQGLYLAFLPFGVRHPKPPSRQPSVYQRAHRRLRADD